MLLLILNALEKRNRQSLEDKILPKNKYKRSYKPELPPFSTQLLSWCWRHNLTQKSLAKRLGIDTSRLNDYIFLRRHRFPDGAFLKLIFEKLSLNDEDRIAFRKAFADSRLSPADEFTHVGLRSR